MAQDELGIAGGDAGVLEQRGGGVPQVVQRDPGQSLLSSDAIEGPQQVAGLDRLASAGREDEVAGSRLTLTGLHVFAELGGVLIQAGGNGREQWQIALPGAGLDRADLQFAGNALDLLADVDALISCIDVAPAQSQDFTAAQAVEHEK